jgi:mono/diheme cytochrome c family protein
MPERVAGPAPARYCMSLLLLVMLTAALPAGDKTQHPVVAGFERFYAGPGKDVGGWLLLSELNCISCHRPEGKDVAAKSAPLLDQVGSRVKHTYLRKFLSSPHKVKPGTAMPDVFAGDADRAPKVEALVHFLAATGLPKHERPDRKLANSGKDVYHKIGCVACHGTRDAKGDAAKVLPTSLPLGDLRAKYTVGSLREFLEKPHQTRPSSRMPDLLNPKEAAEVANYLLQGITTPLPGSSGGNNMKYAYYEGDWEKLPDFDKLKPRATGEAEDFDVHVARRAGNMALKFECYLHLPRAGSYSFHLTSDDGSKLWIDGKLVVNNDGIHAPATKSASVELFKGTHKLVAAVFNAGGGVELGLEIEGPGRGRQPIGTMLSLTEAEAEKVAQAAPKDEDSLQVDSVLVEKGRGLFASAGCASCHQLKTKLPPHVSAKPLTSLRPENGCLSGKPAHGVPWFPLSPSQRTALVAAIKKPNVATAPAEVVQRTLVTFNCYACHERGKMGGMQEELNAYFMTTQQEMGDEGRVPPSLNGVGAKFVPGYLARILDKGSDDRPYMHTRMPGFGAANVGHLVKLFADLDPSQPVSAVSFEQPPAKVKAEARHMVGAQSLGCIRCHTFAGKKAEGVQGIDMTLLTQRLKRDWFHQYLLNPNQFRPGTRMPTSWPDGASLLPKVLDGKAPTQIEAIWTYLADGTKAKLPIGTNKQFIPLTPTDEAIIYRNFIEGAGPRAIGVGYPEKANLAFDANDLRLALVWQGAFIDAARHWTDRGSGFEPPLGDSVLSLPAGVSFAVLDSLQDPWPTKRGRELGYQFRGYSLSKDQRPTFRYSIGTATVEDRPDAVAGASPGIRRTLKVTGPADSLYFRAAVGDKIEALSKGWYRINGDWRIRIEAAGEPQLRQSGGKTELLVPITLRDGQAQLVQEFAW